MGTTPDSATPAIEFIGVEKRFAARGKSAEVLAARRMEIDMRMEKLRIQMDTAQLWAQLEYLIPEEVQQ